MFCRCDSPHAPRSVATLQSVACPCRAHTIAHVSTRVPHTRHLTTEYTKTKAAAELSRRLQVNPLNTSLPENWGGWTRTTNFLINSQAVCQLTYAPSCLVLHDTALKRRAPSGSRSGGRFVTSHTWTRYPDLRKELRLKTPSGFSRLKRRIAVRIGLGRGI